MSKDNIVKCPGCGAGVIVPPGKKATCPLCSTACKVEVEVEISAPTKKGGANA